MNANYHQCFCGPAPSAPQRPGSADPCGAARCPAAADTGPPGVEVFKKKKWDFDDFWWFLMILDYFDWKFSRNNMSWDFGGFGVILSWDFYYLDPTNKQGILMI